MKKHKRRMPSHMEVLRTSLKGIVSEAVITKAINQYKLQRQSTPTLKLSREESKAVATALAGGKLVMRTKAGKIRSFNPTSYVRLVNNTAAMHKAGKLGKKA